MRTPAVVEPDPVADHAHRVLLALEAVAMHALLLDRPDHALDQAVLLRAVRRDELLLQAVAAYKARQVAARKHQAVVRAQQEGCTHAAERAVARDQPLLQRRPGRRRSACS